MVEASGNGHSATFNYDGRNRQISGTIDGAVRSSVWDDWELIEEYDTNNARQMAYLQGAHGVIKSWTHTGATYYYYQDAHGSTTHLADASGHLLESYLYDLYGTPSYFNGSGSSTSAYGIADLWTGERWVGGLGLYDLRNRFMSPEIGRFLQPDPIGFKGDGSNLYRFCHNDPENFTDPSGLFDLWGRLKWFFSGSNLSFADWDAERTRQAALEQTPFSGAVNESGLGRGNWRNSNVVDHAVDDDKMPANHAAGTTYDVAATAQRDGSLKVDSELNWRVAKSAQGKAAVTTEIDSHVRSYRKAETAPDGRIRVALENFKKAGFKGSVAAAARDLNGRLGAARKDERQAQKNQYHGGDAGMLGLDYNPHNMSKNKKLSEPISAQQVEQLIRTLP